MAEGLISFITTPVIQTYLTLFLIAMNAAFIILFFLMRRRLNRFLKGKNGKSMEDAINKSSADISNLADNMENVSRELEKQGEMMIATIKKIGVVRFNPFNNTGGDQSFAIAMLNSKNSGIVISSLYLREGTRIYAKPIEKMKSTYPLSREEEEAMKKAVG
jgi:hypothetical protein